MSWQAPTGIGWEILWRWKNGGIRDAAASELAEIALPHVHPDHRPAVRYWGYSPGNPESVILRATQVDPPYGGDAQELWGIYLFWILKDAGIENRRDLIPVLTALINARRIDLAKETLHEARRAAGVQIEANDV